MANDEYNLTKPQREFFKEYRSVAATPIYGHLDDADLERALARMEPLA